jgi:autotransporter-associated beta strand protein
MKPKGLARNLLGTSALTAAIAVSFVAPKASATSDTWAGTTDTTWATSTNWLGSNVPGTADTATFNDAGNGNTTINLGSGVTLGTLLFDTSSAAAYTIGSGGAGSQTLTLSTAGGGITMNSTVANNELINANLALAVTSTAATPSTYYTVTNNSTTNTLTLAGGISASTTGNKILAVNGSGNTAISGAISAGSGAVNLVKTGTGTLTLSGGGAIGGNFITAYGGTNAAVILGGTTKISSGTYTSAGEFVVGGVLANGGAGVNTNFTMDGGSLNISSYLSLGRGNGVGAVSSDIVLNNSSALTATNFSAGYNNNNTSNLPKGTFTLNNTSTFSDSGVFNFAESVGSNMTMTLNDSSVLTSTATGNNTQYVGNNGTGTLNINGSSTANFAADLHLGASATGNGRVNLNGGTLNFATSATKWFFVGDNGVGRVDVNSGTWKLENNSSIKFSNGTSVGNVINQNGGAVTFYSNAGTTIGGTGALDMQLGGTATANNTYNLNGGTLTVPQIISTQTTGTRTVNLNGGTLKAAKSTTAFFSLGTGNARANVRDGGAIIDTNTFDVTVAQALLHSNVGGDNPVDGGLQKNGLGTLTLSGANTYTGVTNINVGTLALASTGSLTSTQISVSSGATFDVSAVSSYSVGSGVTLTNNGTVNGGFTVAAGGTVNGSGTFSNAVTVNGNLNPGNSPGTVTFANGLALAAGSNLGWELNANTDSGAGTNFDQVLVTGGALTVADGAMLNLSFTGTVDFTDAFWTTDHTWTVVDFAGTGDEGALTLGSISGGVGDFNEFGSFSTSNENGDQVLTWTAVPEPGAALLGGLGMLGLLRRRRQG